MGKAKSSKKVSNMVKAVKWDDLIDLAEENIGRNEARLLQLRALVRFFEGRKAAGEPCPIQAAESAQ